ncbi:MAG: Ig-like domain-containing protein [Leptospiraceae bacterium]|nr:Ig-like domain-containing protein [Leptospiraceae bacterium]
MNNSQKRNCPEDTQNYKSFLTHGDDNFLACEYSYYSNYSCSYSGNYYYDSNSSSEVKHLKETCKELGFTEKMYFNGPRYKCFYIYPTDTSNLYNIPRCGKTVYSNLLNSGMNLNNDTIVPTVDSTNPTNVSDLISKSSPVLIKFSDYMNQETFTNNFITAELNGSQVGITIIKGVNYINIFPSPATDNWVTSQIYTINVSKNVEDFFGNKMSSDYSFQFKTE